MVSVFDDDKWNGLKYVNTRRGVGSEAYLIAYKKGRSTFYFSERGFSLGELCVLRLAKSLLDAPEKSLVLIDEIDMAMHPQAQVRLKNSIIKNANDKNITVIFSTHSVTLIKNFDRKNIIFLKEDCDGTVQCIKEAYPAQILGGIAFSDEYSSDFIFFVEDSQAKILLDQMIRFYICLCVEKTPEKANKIYSPMFRIIPIGGYMQTVDFLNNSKNSFPDYVVRFAFLDQDVKTDAYQNANSAQRKAMDIVFDKNRKLIAYLPCTPEVGLMCLIESKDSIFNKEFSGCFPNVSIDVNGILEDEKYKQLNSIKNRQKAKDRVGFFVEKIHSVTECSSDEIYKYLYELYVKREFEQSDKKDIRSIFGPIFKF